MLVEKIPGIVREFVVGVYLLQEIQNGNGILHSRTLTGEISHSPIQNREASGTMSLVWRFLQYNMETVEMFISPQFFKKP